MLSFSLDATMSSVVLIIGQRLMVEVSKHAFYLSLSTKYPLIIKQHQQGYFAADNRNNGMQNLVKNRD